MLELSENVADKLVLFNGARMLTGAIRRRFDIETVSTRHEADFVFARLIFDLHIVDVFPAKKEVAAVAHLP